MKQKREMLLLLLAGILLLFVVGTAVWAQTSASFDLDWQVIGNGGGESDSANFQVNGTIGQGLASPPGSDSAHASLASGYWVLGSGSSIYLPVTIKD